MDYTNLNIDNNYEVRLEVRTPANMQIDRSPLLAQAILYGIPFKTLENMDFDCLTAIIAECKSRVHMQNNFYIEQEVVPAESSKEVFNLSLYQEFTKGILVKASEYNIPHDPNNFNFYDLRDLVEEYEFLLKEAEDYNIYWDLSEYDPVGLQQLIDQETAREVSYQNDIEFYFKSTRL